jgi:lysophospholipase L1-like esterase
VRTLAALAAVGCLAACGTAPASPATSVRRVPLVITLGDSVPAGTACDCDPFPDVYARGQDAVSENLATPGYTSADVRAQIAGIRAALAGADEVLLMIGANDLAEAFDDESSFPGAAAAMQSNVTATIDTIETIHQTSVIVLGYWNVVQDGKVGAEDYGPSGVRAAASATTYANDALMSAAQKTGATYVSTDPAFHGADRPARPRRRPPQRGRPRGDRRAHPAAGRPRALCPCAGAVDAACKPVQIRSRVNGSDANRTPVASRSALASAGATGLNGLSLIDFAPSGPIASSVSAKCTSVGGTSAKVGRWYCRKPVVVTRPSASMSTCSARLAPSA